MSLFKGLKVVDPSGLPPTHPKARLLLGQDSDSDGEPEAKKASVWELLS